MGALIDDLRGRTREFHQKLEKEPFMTNLIKGQIERHALVDYETCLAVIHGVLEHTLAEHDDPILSKLWNDEFRRLPALLKDLENLRKEDMTVDLSSVGTSLSVADRIMKEAVESPHALLGRLYVLLGSMKGGKVLAPIIAKNLNQSEAEVASYFMGPSDSSGVWNRFLEALEGLDESSLAREDVMVGAESLFRDIQEVAGSLKNSGQRGVHVTGLNPEAGNHAIVQDPVLVGCAIRSGHSICREIPYIEERFGRRGVLFTLSDGAWALDLFQKGGKPLPKQMQWLAKLLSVRGIPSWCLERHLVHLWKEVVDLARLEDVDLVEELERQLECIREYRREHFSQEDQDVWVRETCSELKLENELVPRLMISSIADEMRNWTGSMDILCEHFSNSQLIGAGDFEKLMTSLNRWVGLE